MDQYRETIRAGIAQIDWQELNLFFARSQVIFVDQNLDLEETAYQICMNHTALVDEWMQKGLVQKIADSIAKDWFERKLKVRSVVIQPWVLVQELPSSLGPLKRVD